MIPLLLTDRSIGLRHLLDSDEAEEMRAHRSNAPLVSGLNEQRLDDGS